MASGELSDAGLGHARPGPVPSPRDHSVRFYEEESRLFADVGRFLADGFAKEQAVLVIARPEHRLGFEPVLLRHGIDVDAVRKQGRFVECDAEETLSKFMCGTLAAGRPDRDAFMKVVGAAVSTATLGFPGLRAYGEMVDILAHHGNLDGAAELEGLWNELAQLYSFELHCAYLLDRFDTADRTGSFKAICSLHSHVEPVAAGTDAHALRDLAELQQRAKALEWEVAARRSMEAALRERERELEDFLETASECLHGVGPDGRILWANAAELTLLGYTRAEYVGKHIAEVHADREVIEGMLERLGRGERLVDQEARLRTKSGEIRHVLISSAPLVRDGRFVQTRCFTHDITDRKLADEAQARLAAIIESSDDAIVGKTLDGIITSWNRGAERMFGWAAAEAVGQHITLIIPEARRSEEGEVLRRLRCGERVDHFETVRRTKDGRELDISLTVSPIFDRQGRIVGASKVARDITERKRSDAERQALLATAQEARKQAEQALHTKDEFLAVVSHELRSPLNAIVGWTHLLHMGGLDADGTRRAIETISRNATMQNQLIADLLDVQRLTSGKFRLEMRDSVDLALAVEAAIDTVRPAAQAKGISLIPALDDVPNVPGDPDRIQQMVWNLLSNAVKFTPNGGVVQVRVRVLETDVEIVVEDNGPGMTPEFLPYVFERFRQDAAAGHRKGGLGLGLAIVRNLAELHGGSVSAANRTGGGAVFTIRLPRVRISPVSAVATVAEAVPATSLHGTKVLVIDDEPEAREMIALVLAHCGADVVVATSAADGMALLLRERPDVLLCDLTMPDEDGYSLLRRVRALPAGEGGRTPAVALTAAASAEERVRALRCGFQIHVAKPVEPLELSAVIASLTTGRQP